MGIRVHFRSLYSTRCIANYISNRIFQRRRSLGRGESVNKGVHKELYVCVCFVFVLVLELVLVFVFVFVLKLLTDQKSDMKRFHIERYNTG